MTTPKQPPVPLTREHTVLTPRGERIPTVLTTYKHHVFEKDDTLEDMSWNERATCALKVCEVHLGGTMCDHGWVYATEGEK